MMRRSVFWSALLLVILLAACSAEQQSNLSKQVPAGGPVSDDAVNSIAREMYCPICENIPLDVCPTQACAQWRELIREKLAQGWNKSQIKEYFVAQYGDRVLAEPPARGLNWLVYLIPPILFLAAIYFVIHVLRDARLPASTAPASPSTGAQAPAGSENDPYLRRLEEELRRRDQA